MARWALWWAGPLAAASLARRDQAALGADGTVEVGSDPRCRPGEGYWTFGYGSNRLSQIQARCQNPALGAVKAHLPGYRRFFAGWSKAWQGSVASVAPSPEDVVKGSAIFLTEAEALNLDNYEVAAASKACRAACRWPANRAAPTEDAAELRACRARCAGGVPVTEDGAPRYGLSQGWEPAPAAADPRAGLGDADRAALLEKLALERPWLRIPENFYHRELADVHLDLEGEQVVCLGMLYVMNPKGDVHVQAQADEGLDHPLAWRGPPSSEYLAAVRENLEPFWPNLDAPDRPALLLKDHAGTCKGVYEAARGAHQDALACALLDEAARRGRGA